MTKLQLEKNIKDIQSIALVDDCQLVKKEDSLLLLDLNEKIIKGVKDSGYTKSIIVNKDKTYIALVSSLFCEEFHVYSYPDLKAVITLNKIDSKGYYYKDAAFSSDGKYLYVLADEKSDSSYHESVLVRIDLNYQKYTSYFRGEGMHFDSLYYSKTKQALLLLEKKGRVSFFNQGKIIDRIKTPPYDKLSVIDWGQVLLLSSFAGFVLCSLKGKVIRTCDFLLPKPLKNDERVRTEFEMENELLQLRGMNRMSVKDNLGEHYKDMVFSSEVGALFYLSYNMNDKTYRLYHYSIKTFALKHVYKIKGEVYHIHLAFPNLYIKTTDGVLVYRILHD